MLQIVDLERTLEDLPLLPIVVARLLALSPNDEDYFEQVLTLSQEDPPLALRLIKLANSASSAPMNPITSLQGAIVRIGARQIAGLITSMAVMRVFMPSTQGERNLWIHGIEVAVASRVIAHIASSLKIDPEQAYLCGLMHDIGRFILFQGATEELGQVDESNWTTPKQLIEIEQEIYGFDHAELGWHACKKWCLPELVTAVVKNHHVYDLPEQLSKDKKLANLIRVVQMADFFSVFAILNPDFLTWEPKKLEQKLHDNCIHPSCSEPPISAHQLQNQASGILEESKKIISGLGIRTSE